MASRPCWTIALAFLMVTPAWADTLVVPILGYDIMVGLDLPPISEFEGNAAPRRFRYFGSSHSTGISISIHVEPFGGTENAACATKYWEMASRNPLLKADSVERSESEKFVRVIYLLEGEIENEQVKSANANYYFVSNGGCIDVHISRHPYSDGDLERVAQAGDSLVWQRMK